MNKRIIIEIIVIIVVALGYMFFNSNKSTTENNESIENLQSNKDESEIVNEKENQNTIGLDKKIIIAYFSLPETNGSAKEDSTITVNGENLGNTQYVANLIQGYDVVYQAIIPAGATLTNSKSMNGAVRGIYHGNNGIQGQANFVAVNQSSQVIANSVSTGINITSMIVGQYYMAQINSELAKINDEILKNSNFQDTEYKSKILALLIQIKRISTFQTEILENKRLRDSDIDKLNTYTKQVTDVRNSLVSWHENVTKKLGIDLETARRKRKGLDGAIHWIPGLFKDDFNFSTLSEQTKAMIEEQTLNYDLNAKFSISDSFNKDVKLISKDGKLYYLP